VAALWKGRATLAGKRVTVRGKVVKFNGGILGVNWIHIQDGTGRAADGSNDITVTSDMTATVGDVVTVTGIVGLNKDLGSGYSYPVIIERATSCGGKVGPRSVRRRHAGRGVRNPVRLRSRGGRTLQTPTVRFGLPALQL
jgi:hypothetical protein